MRVAAALDVVSVVHRANFSDHHAHPSLVLADHLPPATDAAGPTASLGLSPRPMARTASLKRTTSETDINLTLSLDGSGRADIATGIGFLDHMLTALTRHALFDLTVQAKGDLHIDFHHTTEDVGIVLGQAFAKAIGDKRGIRRFGHAVVPMDETLAEAA